MKPWLPVLFLIAGLGSSFPSAQAAKLKDPFTRYMAGIKRGAMEPSLTRFASECHVNISNVKPRFAVGAGSSLTEVKNLSMSLRSLETDFYSTAEVWVQGKDVLVEFWANSDDVGSEVRYLDCFEDRKLMLAEVIEWHVPVEQEDPPAWGYFRRWERTSDQQLQRTKLEFVDGMERAIPKPKLDADGERSLEWIPSLGPFSDLNLPSAILQ